jgi:hypothetical protein
MPFQKGQSGNPSGGGHEKPFRDALRMEIAALSQGELIQHPKGSLRWNAQRLLMFGDPHSISMIADRLDGKPAQESTVTLVKRDENDWTRAELVAFINDARARGGAAAPENGRGGGSNQVH